MKAKINRILHPVRHEASHQIAKIENVEAYANCCKQNLKKDDSKKDNRTIPKMCYSLLQDETDSIEKEEMYTGVTRSAEYQ